MNYQSVCTAEFYILIAFSVAFLIVGFLKRDVYDISLATFCAVLASICDNDIEDDK